MLGLRSLRNRLAVVFGLIVFGAVAVLTLRTGLIGLALTPASAAGAWAGKHIVERLPVRVFVLLVEVGLIAAGGLTGLTAGSAGISSLRRAHSEGAEDDS